MSGSQADRTILLLQRRSQNRITPALLAPGHVAVSLGDDISAEPQAQLLFSFAVNLLARLFPVVQDLTVIVSPSTPLRAPVPRWAGSTLKEHIANFLQSLDPPLAWRIDHKMRGEPQQMLAIGHPHAAIENVVFAGSQGWTASISLAAPARALGEPNPIGAYAAACLGVGEIWKRLLLPHRDLFEGMPIIPLDRDLDFSTYTYDATSEGANPNLPRPVEVGRLTIVGLGAGGGALVYALASLPEIRGHLNLIDPEKVIQPNLNRYVFADAGDARSNAFKVAVVRDMLQGFGGLMVATYDTPFTEAANLLSTEDFRHVAALVHSREARRAIQLETPMVLWDAAAAEDGEFRVWRMVLGVTECMVCKHPPSAADPERQKASQLAALLGLDADAWLRKLGNNEVFTPEEVAAITAHAGTRAHEFELPSAGQHYGDWDAEQCGRLPFPDTDEEIPIPFAPVMAGMLVAGEIIKEGHFPAAVLDSRYRNTLVGNFMRRSKANRIPPRGECQFCHDKDFLAQYRRRWG